MEASAIPAYVEVNPCPLLPSKRIYVLLLPRYMFLLEVSHMPFGRSRNGALYAQRGRVKCKPLILTQTFSKTHPWVSNFGHVTTKVNVHGQNSSTEVSFLVIIFLSSQFELCYIAYRPRQLRCFLKMYLVSSNVLYFMWSFKQCLQFVDDNVHTIVYKCWWKLNKRYRCQF
jgi:hypothetical protein